ncbi:MAG: hypothetical protein ACK5T6_01670, partial [Pirellula sp.]
TMMYSKSALVAFALLCNSFAANVSAQLGGETGPTPTPVLLPDDKPIENSPASSPNQLNCWVSRSNEEAIAVSVYRDSSLQLVGKLRRYSKGDEEFEDKDTEIKLTTTTNTPPMKLVPFKLEKETSSKFQDVFSMMYTPATGDAIRIGYLSFIRGNKSRLSSSVVIRLDHNKIVGTPDPCGGPPVDDLGEEEEIRRAPSATFGENAPGASLSLIVVNP